MVMNAYLTSRPPMEDNVKLKEAFVVRALDHRGRAGMIISLIG